MATIVVPFLCRIVQKKSPAVLFRNIPLESHIVPVVDIVPTIELFGPLIWFVQQVPQSRHRAVVQIRSPQPESVQERVDVAIGFFEIAELPKLSSPHHENRSDFFQFSFQSLRERIDPVAIRAEFFDRTTSPNLLSWQSAQCSW